MTAYWLKKQIFNHFIMYTTQIDRDRDFAHFFYKFLCFEVVLPLQIYYITLEDMKKVHLISDFRKKNLLSWGSNPRKWDRTWRNLCPSKPEGQENVLSFGYDFRRRVFVCFLEEIEDTKKTFEIIWPLVVKLHFNPFSHMFS